MPPPSPLGIATSSLNRYVKEEASYRKELVLQQSRITKLENDTGDDENAEYLLNQERKALDETKAVLPRLRQNIQDASTRLEQQLEQSKSDAMATEIAQANDALVFARNALKQIA